MATIKVGYGRDGFGDRQPLIDTVLRDIASDLAALNGAAEGALASSAPAALTSTQNTTTAAVDLTTSEALANALKANYNALQTDVVALRATVAAIQADLVAGRAALNSESGQSLKTIAG